MDLNVRILHEDDGGIAIVLSQSFQSCDPFYDAECRMLSKRCRAGYLSKASASGSRTDVDQVAPADAREVTNSFQLLRITL
jgi:hypothetical protein